MLRLCTLITSWALLSISKTGSIATSWKDTGCYCFRRRLWQRRMVLEFPSIARLSKNATVCSVPVHQKKYVYQMEPHCLITLLLHWENIQSQNARHVTLHGPLYSPRWNQLRWACSQHWEWQASFGVCGRVPLLRWLDLPWSWTTSYCLIWPLVCTLATVRWSLTRGKIASGIWLW